MNDKKTPEKECKNPFCPAMVNSFDAMMMVVVRRFDRALRELENRKAPLNEVELLHQNARLRRNSRKKQNAKSRRYQSRMCQSNRHRLFISSQNPNLKIRKRGNYNDKQLYPC